MVIYRGAHKGFEVSSPRYLLRYNLALLLGNTTQVSFRESSDRSRYRAISFKKGIASMQAIFFL
jgi:hypothetical protein